MTDKIINTTIDILGKHYPVRCLESEIQSLQEAAAYLNKRMCEVQESGKAINVERIAIMTALNITHEFLELGQQKNTFTNRVNSRINHLQNKLDVAIQRAMQTELVYTTD